MPTGTRRLAVPQHRLIQRQRGPEEVGRRNDAAAAMDAAIAVTRVAGDAQTAALYQQQRAFYASGGKVAASPR